MARARKVPLQAGILPPEASEEEQAVVLRELLASVESPARFARSLGKVHMWSRQIAVLEALSNHSKVVAVSAHAEGKTFLAAWAVLWWMFRWIPEPAYVVTTAPTAHQVKNLLWKEIRAAWARLPEIMQHRGECLQTELKMYRPDGSEDPLWRAYGKSSDDPEKLQGEHAAHMLIIADEACAIPDERFGVLDSFQAEKVLLIGNPTRLNGYFHRAATRPGMNYQRVDIPATANPNWTGEEFPPQFAKQLLRPETAAQWAADWGEDSDFYRARVLAQFPTSDESTIIVPIAWFEDAVERSRKRTEGAPLDGVGQVGVDVARFGSDRTVIATRIGDTLIDLVAYEGDTDTRKVAQLAREAGAALANRHPGEILVLVDETGLGAGVVDQLPRKEGRCNFHGVNFSKGATDKDAAVNWVSEQYFGLRARFKAGTTYDPIHIQCSGKAVDRLCAQLSQRQWKYENSRFAVEKKEDMKLRGLPSPDESDAVMLAFAAWERPAFFCFTLAAVAEARRAEEMALLAGAGVDMTSGAD